MLVVPRLLWIAALVLALTAPAHADVDGDRYRSEQWRVSIALPTKWQITEQTSYPNIILWMVRPSPRAEMLLSAEHLDEPLDAQEYALATLELLEKLGFRARAPQLHGATGAYWIDFDNGEVFLRQALLVSGGIGYSLTLATDDSGTRGQLLRVFDYVLRSIKPLREKREPADE